MIRSVRWAISAAAALMPFFAARAQRSVRGVVTDSATASPIAGAVITLQSADGASLGRTVTGAGGEFAIGASSGMATRVRAVRIGFHPKEIALAGLGDSSLHISMVRLASLLDVVRVTDRELCPNSPDRGGAFTLWEQVRAGLLNEIVAREANPAVATMVTYERRQSAGDRIVERQTVRMRSGSTTRPFVAAATARQFAEAGFMSTDTLGQTLFAPDADVLLDEAFGASHCFHLQSADAAHAGQVGLAFTPARQRSGVVDVTGVVWVDAATPELRSLEFRHTGLDRRLERTPSGGHVEFHTAANGVSFIERWWIDIPIVRVHPGATGSIQGGRISASQSDQYTIEETYYSGGSVVSARWRDGSSWATPTVEVTGVAVEQGTGRPVAGALVSLDGMIDTVATDESGHFSLWPLVAGKYKLRLADTTLEAFARGRTASRIVDAPNASGVELRIEVPPIRETIAQVCKTDSKVFNAVVVGHLVDRDSGFKDNGAVFATWRMNVAGQGALDLNREAVVDEHGRFLLCGVPSDVALRVVWKRGTARADTVVSLGRREVGRLEWRLPPATTRPPTNP